jgi:crossover junction endodeoxyribonuclease RuvC
MRVIGIDPGTALTGWGVVEYTNGRMTSVEYGCIKTSTKESRAERLKQIYLALLDLIAATTPDVMAIEMIFFNTNVKTALSVGQARGVCLLAAAMTGLPAYEYNTSEVKNLITGYGRSTKTEVAGRVKELLALEKIPRPDDVSVPLEIQQQGERDKP